MKIICYNSTMKFVDCADTAEFFINTNQIGYVQFAASETVKITSLDDSVLLGNADSQTEKSIVTNKSFYCNIRENGFITIRVEKASVIINLFSAKFNDIHQIYKIGDFTGGFQINDDQNNTDVNIFRRFTNFTTFFLVSNTLTGDAMSFSGLSKLDTLYIHFASKITCDCKALLDKMAEKRKSGTMVFCIPPKATNVPEGFVVGQYKPKQKIIFSESGWEAVVES